MDANDVDNAIGITSSGLTPTLGNKYTNAGTITKPPPIPNKPARKPATQPSIKQNINVLMIITTYLREQIHPNQVALIVHLNNYALVSHWKR